MAHVESKGIIEHIGDLNTKVMAFVGVVGLLTCNIGITAFAAMEYAAARAIVTLAKTLNNKNASAAHH